MLKFWENEFYNKKRSVDTHSRREKKIIVCLLDWYITYTVVRIALVCCVEGIYVYCSVLQGIVKKRMTKYTVVN